MTRSPTVLEGPSRHLPPPFDAAARAAWDAASFHGRRWGRAVPLSLAQAVAFGAEWAQRPSAPVTRVTDGQVVAEYRGTDPVLRDRVLSIVVPQGADAPAGPREADVLFREIPTLAAERHARAGGLVLPHFVELDVDLTVPESERFGTRRKESVRRVERSGYRLEIARGSVAARHFYDAMFVPTARARHGAHAIVRRFRYVEAAVNEGALLFVTDGASRLAGLVVVPRFGVARAWDAWLFGVRSGAYEASTVAREAAYLFAMRWAESRGATRFGLTTALPFSSDGLARYKQSWGADARPGLRSATALALRIDCGSPELTRRLHEAGPWCIDFSRTPAALFTPAEFV